MKWFRSKKEVPKEEPLVRELSSFQKELAEKAQAKIDEKDALEKARRDTVEREVRVQFVPLLKKYAEKGMPSVEAKPLAHEMRFSVEAHESQICFLFKELCDELGVYRKDYTNHSWNHTIYLIPPK